MTTDRLIHLGRREDISPSSILMLKADRNYTIIYLEDGTKLLSSTNLGLIEERLQPYAFFRVNRSTVINLEHLNRFTVIPHKAKDKRQNFCKKNTTEIFLSRRRVAEFRACVNV